MARFVIRNVLRFALLAFFLVAVLLSFDNVLMVLEGSIAESARP